MYHITLVGLSHRNAGVEVRERFALSHACTPENWAIPLDYPVQEALILSTCNRVEIVAASPARPGCPACTEAAVHEVIVRHWASACNADSRELQAHTYILHQHDAVRHVFAVASSLDSMIVGEPQILGQMKEAYRLAVEAGTTGLMLNRLLHRAFFVAKRVRTETAVAANAVSISYAAVELAKRIFDDVSSRRALLIGAGEMAELAALHLIQAGVRHVSVTNRTLSRAQELATRFNGTAIPFDRLHDALAEADIIISSTGADEPIILPDTMRETLKKRRQRPMFFIDIAVPRDIHPDVNKLDNVYVYDIDNLKVIVEENTRHRHAEADKARAIVDEECAAFMQWQDSLKLQPAIVDLIRTHENMAEQALQKMLRQMGERIDKETENAVRMMLASLVRKIDHDPIMYLKSCQNAEAHNEEQAVALIRTLFSLDKRGQIK